MPVLKITAADIQKIKTIDEGWYPAKTVKVSELEKSKDGKSLNLRVTSLLMNADGKEIESVFNSQLIGKIIPLVEASRGSMGSIVHGKAGEDFQLDTSELLDKQYDAHVVIDVYNNNPINKIDSYAPWGTQVGKAQVF